MRLIPRPYGLEGELLKGHFGVAVQDHPAGQQLQVMDAHPLGEKDTEPLPPFRQMLSWRVTLTRSCSPESRLPLPLALMFPLVPVTLQSTGPPWAVTVIQQEYVPCMRQPETASVPGPCGGGGAGR
jgi:hypothetical protein